MGGWLHYQKCKMLLLDHAMVQKDYESCSCNLRCTLYTTIKHSYQPQVYFCLYVFPATTIATSVWNNITVVFELYTGGLAGLVLCLFAKLQKKCDASKCRRDGEGLLERVRETERVVFLFPMLICKCSLC